MIKTTLELDRNNLVTLRRKADEILAEFRKHPDRKWASLDLGDIRIMVRNRGKSYTRKKKVPQTLMDLFAPQSNEKPSGCKGTCPGCNATPCQSVTEKTERLEIGVEHNEATGMIEVTFSRKPYAHEIGSTFENLKKDGFGWNGKSWIKRYTPRGLTEAVCKYDTRSPDNT